MNDNFDIEKHLEELISQVKKSQTAYGMEALSDQLDEVDNNDDERLGTQQIGCAASDAVSNYETIKSNIINKFNSIVNSSKETTQ